MNELPPNKDGLDDKGTAPANGTPGQGEETPNNDNSNAAPANGTPSEELEGIYKRYGQDPEKLATTIKEKEKGAQQLVEKLKQKELKLVEQDPFYLLELHKENPKLANSIAKEKFSKTFDEVEAELFKQQDEERRAKGEEPEISEIVAREVDRKLRSQKEENLKQTEEDKRNNRKQEVLNLKTQFIADNKLTADGIAQFDKEFQFLADGKDLDAEQANKILRLSYKEVFNKEPYVAERERKVTQSLAGLPSIGLGTNNFEGKRQPVLTARQIEIARKSGHDPQQVYK